MHIIEPIFSFLGQKEVYGLCLIIIIGIIISKLSNYLIEKIIIHGKNDYEKKKRKTIVDLLTNIFKWIIYIFIIYFILGLYGVNTKGFITSFGIASALIGLALQDTAKDIISGISIIMDNYFVVGDIITINGFTGEVIKLSLKSTKIKKYTGEVMVLANRNIDQVINISKRKANIVINIPTSYELKTDVVEKAMAKILTEAKKIKGVSNESKYLGISSFNESSIDYSISIICNQEEQWQIKRSVLKIVKDIYDKEKLTIPYKQIEVHYNERV